MQEEAHKEAIWQIQVAKNLLSLTTEVERKDQEVLAHITELLDAAEKGPKELIMAGKLKVAPKAKEETDDPQVSKHRLRLNQLKKEKYLKNIRNKLEMQYLADSLNHQDYTIRLKEIKDLEENKDIDWGTFKPTEDEEVKVPEASPKNQQSEKQESPAPFSFAKYKQPKSSIEKQPIFELFEATKAKAAAQYSVKPPLSLRESRREA